jgi:hypothetical protein
MPIFSTEFSGLLGGLAAAGFFVGISALLVWLLVANRKFFFLLAIGYPAAVVGWIVCVGIATELLGNLIGPLGLLIGFVGGTLAYGWVLVTLLKAGLRKDDATARPLDKRAPKDGPREDAAARPALDLALLTYAAQAGVSYEQAMVMRRHGITKRGAIFLYKGHRFSTLAMATVWAEQGAT